MQSVSKEAEAFLASLRIPAATGTASNPTKDEPGGGDAFLIRFTNDDSDSDAEGLRESNQGGLPADAAGRLQQGTGFFPSSGLQRDVKSMPRVGDPRRTKEQGKGSVQSAAAAAQSRSSVVPQPGSARPESEQARAVKGNLPSSRDGPVGGHQVNELEMLRQQIAERESELQRRRQAFGTLAAKAPPLSEGGAATQFPLPRRRQPVHAQEKKQAPTSAPQTQAVAQGGVTSSSLAGVVAAEAEVSHKEMPGPDFPLLHQTSSRVVRPSSMDRRLPSRSARTDTEGKMRLLPQMAAALSSGRSGVQGLATQTGAAVEEKSLVPQSSTSKLAHGDPHAVLLSEGAREFLPGNRGGAEAQRHDRAETGREGVTQQGGLAGSKRLRSQSDTGPLPKHSDDVAPRKVARGEPPVGGVPQPRKSSFLESTASGTHVKRSYAGNKASQSNEDDYVATASKWTGGGGAVAALAADASVAMPKDLSFAGLVEPHGARVDVVAVFGDGELATSAGPPLDLPQLDGSGALEGGRQMRVAGRQGQSFAFLTDEGEQVRQQLRFQQGEDADLFPDVSLNGDAFASGRSESMTDEGTGGNRSGNEGRLRRQVVGSSVRVPSPSMQGKKGSARMSLHRRDMLQKVREMEAARRGRTLPGRRVERVGGLMSKQIGNSGTVAGLVGFEYGMVTADGAGLNLEAAEREADELLEQEEKNRRRLEVRERMLRNQLREVGRALKESNDKCEEYRCRRDMAGSQWQSLQALQHPSAAELLSSVSRERSLLRLPAPSDWRDPINVVDTAVGPDVNIRTTPALETRVQQPKIIAQPSRIVETTHREVMAGKQGQDQHTLVRTRTQDQHTGKKFGEQMRPEKENAGVRATLVDECDFGRRDMVEEVHTSETRGGAHLPELPSGNAVSTFVKRTDQSLKADLFGAGPGVAVRNAEREELLGEKESGPEGPRGAFSGSGESKKIQISDGRGEETTRKSTGIPLIGSAEESAVLVEKGEPALFSSPKDGTHAVVRTDAGISFKEGHVSHAPVVHTGVNAGDLPGGSALAVLGTKLSHQLIGRADASTPSIKESKEVRSGSRLKTSAPRLVEQPAGEELSQRKEGASTSPDTAAAQAVDSGNRDGRPDRVRRRWEPVVQAVSVGNPELGDVPNMGMQTPREAMVGTPPPPSLDIGNRALPGPPPFRGRAEEAEALRRAVERSVLDNRDHRNTGFGDVPPMMQQGWAPAEAGGREDPGGRGTALFGRRPRRPSTQGSIGDGSHGSDRSYGGQRAETVRYDGVSAFNDGMQQEGGRDVDVARRGVGKHTEEMRHDVGGRHHEGAWQDGPRYIRHEGGKHMDMRHNSRRHGEVGRHDGWRQDESPRYGAQADGAHADAMGQQEAVDMQRGSLRSGERSMGRLDSRLNDVEEAYKAVGRIGSFKNVGPAERDVRGGALKRKSEVHTNERMNKAVAFFDDGEQREQTFRPQSGDLKRREEDGGIEMERGNVKIAGGVGEERPPFPSGAVSPARKEREEKERRDNMMTERREKDVERYSDRRQREWREREDREQREKDEREREERDAREREERDKEGGNKDWHSRKEVQRKERDRQEFIKERSELDRVRSRERERERDRRSGERREKWAGIDEERKPSGRSPRERHERPLVRGREDKDRGGENRGRERERSADGEGYVRDERRSADAFGGDVRARDGERLADGDNPGKVDPRTVDVDRRGKDKSPEHLPPPPPSKRDRFSGKELQVSGEGRKSQRSLPQIEADSGERLGSEDSTDMEERLAKRRRESLWDRECGQGQVPFHGKDDYGRSSKGRGPARSGDGVAKKDREGTVDRRAGNANGKNIDDDGPNITVQDVSEGPNEGERQHGKGTSRMEASEKRGDAHASIKVVEDAGEGAGVPGRRSAAGREGHDTSDRYGNVRANAQSDANAAWGTSLGLVAVPEVEDGAGGTQESRVQLTEVLTQRAAHGGNWWQGGCPESGRMPVEDRDYQMSESEFPTATGSVLFDGSVAGGGSLPVVDVPAAAGVPSQRQDNSSKIDSGTGLVSAAKERSDVAHLERIRVDSKVQFGESAGRDNNMDVVTIHGACGESLEGQSGKNEDEGVRDLEATGNAVRMESGENAELNRDPEDLPAGAGQSGRDEFVVAEQPTPEGGGAALQCHSPRVKESLVHVMEDTSVGKLAPEVVGDAVKECIDGQDAQALSKQGELPGSRHVTDWDLNVPFSGEDGDGSEITEPASVQPSSMSLESPLPMPAPPAEGARLITATKEPLLVTAAENSGIQEAAASEPGDGKAVVLPALIELPDVFKDDVWALPGFAQPIFKHVFNWCANNTDMIVPVIEERMEAVRVERGEVFGSYESPLTMLRSFRVNPHFKRMGLSALSLTWSNKVDLRRPLCKFEHRGKCVDRECPGQHVDDYVPSEAEVEEELVGQLGWENDVPKLEETKGIETMDVMVGQIGHGKSEVKTGNIDKTLLPNITARTYLGPGPDGADQIACYRIGNLTFERLQIPVPGPLVGPSVSSRRGWLSSSSLSPAIRRHLAPDVSHLVKADRAWGSLDPLSSSWPGSAERSGTDWRYFGDNQYRLDRLEAHVLQNRSDWEGWLELAAEIVNYDWNTQDVFAREQALIVLSRGLEANESTPCLWIAYLRLFHQQNNEREQEDNFYHAVQKNSSSYELWSMFIDSRSTLVLRLESYEQAIVGLASNTVEESADKKTSRESVDRRSQCLVDLALQMLHCMCEAECQEEALAWCDELASSGISIKQSTSSESQTQKVNSISVLHAALQPREACVLWVACAFLALHGYLPPSFTRSIFYEQELPFSLDWGTCIMSQDKQAERGKVELAMLLMQSGASILMLDQPVPGQQDANIARQAFAVNYVRCMSRCEGPAQARDMGQRLLAVYPGSVELIHACAEVEDQTAERTSSCDYFNAAIQNVSQREGALSQRFYASYMSYLLRHHGEVAAGDCLSRAADAAVKSLKNSLHTCPPAGVVSGMILVDKMNGGKGVESLGSWENADGRERNDVLDLFATFCQKARQGHISQDGVPREDVSYACVNLALGHALRGNAAAAEAALHDGFQAADCARDKWHLLLELCAFKRGRISSSAVESASKSALDQLAVFLDVHQTQLEETLSRPSLWKAGDMPRLWKLQALVAGPHGARSSSTMHALLKVWFDEPLLPLVEKGKACEHSVVALVEALMAKAPCDVRLALATCKSVESAHPSALAWALTLLVSALLSSASPATAPPQAWEYAIDVLRNIGDLRAAEELMEWALYLHPMSTTLWQHLIRVRQALGDSAAADAAIDLAEARFNSDS